MDYSNLMNDLEISLDLRMRIAEEAHEKRCKEQNKTMAEIGRREARRKIDDIRDSLFIKSEYDYF